MVTVKLNREAVEVAMVRNNLTQNALARNLGISSGHMSQVMAGRRRPSPQVRCRMLQCLRGYKFDDLFVIDHGDRSKTE